MPLELLTPTNFHLIIETIISNDQVLINRYTILYSHIVNNHIKIFLSKITVKKPS